MNRNSFIKGLASIGTFLSFSSFQKKKETSTIRQELIEAWEASKTTTLGIIDQMPEEHFSYKYTPESMSFAEQFRHCAVFSYQIFKGKLSLPNPYEKEKPKVLLSKQETRDVTEKLYTTVLDWIQNYPEADFYKKTDFNGVNMPAWRLFYAMENHVIHHRGQAIVYLRLKGVIPKSYFGW
ncbi:MAG: DinB family protein [Leadbetterella sp.]